MKKHLKRLIILVVILLVCGMGYKFLKRNKTVVAPTTMTAELSNLNLEYNVQGRIESKKVVSVFSNDVAVVEKVNFRSGEEVKKGDVLLELKDENGEIKKLNLEKSKLYLNMAKKNYEDTKKLYEIGGVSKDELNRTYIEYKDAIIKEKLSQTEFNNFKKLIISPISGVILKAEADVNYTIDARVPLFKIADTENLQIVLGISNSKAKNIKEGMIVNVTSSSLDKDIVLKGTIKSISKTSFKADNSKEYLTNVTVELDDYKTLKPGDLIDANIVYKAIENKVIVPFQYIVKEEGKDYIYTLKDNEVSRKEIVIKAEDGINYQVEGIEKGEILLYNPNNQYKLGDKIK